MTTINELKQKAEQAVAAAWGVQATRQTDGTTLDLCYSGRLHRAYQRLVDARQRGDAALAVKLDAAIGQLTAAYNAACSEAEAACSAYAAACAAAGVAVDDLYPKDCQCAGCVEANSVHHVGSALGNVRAAVWALLGDDGDGEPPIVPLMRKAPSDETARGRLWQHIVRIGDAMQVYMAECNEHGEPVAWRELFA